MAGFFPRRATQTLLWTLGALASLSIHQAGYAEDIQGGSDDRALRPRVLMDNALPVSHIAPGHGGAVGATVTQASARLGGLQAAPMPDEDSSAPAEAVSTDPSLRPAFFGRKTTFKGDGFMHGSDIESDQAHRQKPTGGLSLNIPVQ